MKWKKLREQGTTFQFWIEDLKGLRNRTSLLVLIVFLFIAAN